MISKIKESVAYIQKKYKTAPSVGIVLGSGLGSFTAEMKDQPRCRDPGRRRAGESTGAGQSAARTTPVDG